MNEKQELNMALTSGGSMVQDIIDKTNRMESQKNDVQKQLDDVNKRVKGEEDLINSINQAGIKVTSDANRLREEIKNLESDCEKSEEDKMTKDNQIITLREEIAHQEELISKLQKEKKGAGEGRQKTEEDIQAMEDKCNHLSKVKGKLEQSLGSKYTKQIKELQGRIDELDEELVIERQARAKAEKNRAILSRDIEDLSGRLEEAGSNTGTQIELNKKREAELAKLKAEHDKAAMERDLMATRQGLDEAMRE